MGDIPHDYRFTVLTWAVGLTAALGIATLGMIVTLSYQIGQIAGELGVLIGHVHVGNQVYTNCN